MSDSGQLGTIVSWRVPAEVAVGELRTAMASAGIDPKMAADMAPKNALARALREMKKGRVIRQLRREGEKIWFQFTREHLDKMEATYSKEAELSLDVKTGDVYCSDQGLQDKATELLKQHTAKRLTNDLTRLVQRIYDSRKADLIPIREQGGAYFVPDMHREVVDQTRSLLSEIGGNLRSFDVRLGSDDTSASVADSMNEYLVNLLQEFDESIADVTDESSKRIKNSRKRSVKEIRQKLECYKGILGAWAESLEKKLEDSEVELLKKIVLESNKEAAETETEATEVPAEAPADAPAKSETATEKPTAETQAEDASEEDSASMPGFLDYSNV